MDTSQPQTSNNNWGRYEALVLSELKDLKASHKELLDSMSEVKLELNTLKIKTALWGSIAGAGVSGIVSIIVGLFLKSAKGL